MNVLLTSVGRRAYMVKYFKNVLGDSGEVHVCNSDAMSVAFHYADKAFVSPLIYSDSYIPTLVEYCKKNRIDLLISLFDIDLLVLAKNKQLFEAVGTRVVVSGADIVSVCNDKWLTYQYLAKNGFYTPRSYITLENALTAIDREEISYPVMVKPRFGCGSISIATAYDEEELRYLTKKLNREISRSYLKYESSVTEDKIIYQEQLRGQEYGADIINDLDGNFRNVIIRKKLAMRSGETDIAELVSAPDIEAELQRLGKLTGHIANMDCDIFYVDEKPYILEMNARFGGGYPFSHLGGCDLPQAIVKWHKGEPVENEMLSARTGIVGFKEILITLA